MFFQSFLDNHAIGLKEIYTATLGKHYHFLRMLKYLYDPAIPSLGIYPTEMKTYDYKKLVYKCSWQHHS